VHREVDELVCLQSPPHFQAVGQFYQRFDQTDDRQVIALLRDAAARYTLPP
jgi:predicted phosphoribosyltransferase